MKIKQDTLIAVFSRRFRVYFVQKSTFERRENTTWALPFCVCHYVSVTSWTRPVLVDEMHILPHGPTFFCSSWMNSQPSWLFPEELKCELKEKKNEKNKVGVGGYWCKTYWQNNRTKRARENIITFSKFSGPFASSLACHRENLAWNVNSNNLTVTVLCTVCQNICCCC